MDMKPDDPNEREFTGDSYITLFGRTMSTIYTTSEEYVNLWITHHIHYPNDDPTTRTKLIVGLDIDFVDPDNLYPLIATISVCVNGECLIYHMYDALRQPIGLQRFITDPNITFVGVNLEHKLRVLRYWVPYKSHIPYRNLGVLAERRYHRPQLLHANMCELAFAVLGKKLVMPAVNTDWDRSVLLEKQVLHASVSAYVAYELGRALLN